MLVTLLLLLALTCGAAIALGLLIVGLFEAPWLFLLVLLGLGLWGLQRVAVYATAEDEPTSEEAPTEPSAQPASPIHDGPTFTYRGVKYNAPSPEKSQGESAQVTEGVYRGQRWRRTNNADTSESAPSSAQPRPEMKYRGHTVQQ
ncbi:DUF4278 domain-containing protein [Leptolyngbya iicbica]|uniref:DUF4278 domain-containing protein n=2 Tax=Cyanophyceae TaxID=3028117 RepID=A0A4V2E3K3_9CYAN|nr:DUF4278 domain-containing protein [Leptolyngbya sp. LK]RZM82740.1 DUF4278 domain-containing protein [Leptolyngbya sp. LK]